MSRNELPESGDWEAVHTCIHRRMKKLDMSIARLSRESGVSETSIRYIGRAEKRQRSTLVALSAALGWRHDYLVNVLHGEADPRVPAPAPADTAAIYAELRAEVDCLTEKLDRLAKAVRSAGREAEMILGPP